MEQKTNFVYYSADGEFHVSQDNPLKTTITLEGQAELFVRLDYGWIEYSNKDIVVKLYIREDEFFFARRTGGTFESFEISELSAEEKHIMREHLDTIEQRIFQHMLCAQLVFVIKATSVLKYRLRINSNTL